MIKTIKHILAIILLVLLLFMVFSGPGFINGLNLPRTDEGHFSEAEGFVLYHEQAVAAFYFILMICLFIVPSLIIYLKQTARKTEVVDGKGIAGTDVKDPRPSLKIYLKPIGDYSATIEEMKQVEKAIEKDGVWEETVEWRISTLMSSRIEPKIQHDKRWFITTVKCEQEVMIPAASIERAIIFKKLYQDFQMEIWHELGWASSMK